MGRLVDCPDENRKAIEFIWSGQTGLAEVVWDYGKRRHLSVPEALDSLADYRVFSPLLRTYAGSTKEAVTPLGNVLWTDIDSRDGLDRIKGFAAEQKLTPSVVVDSGNKGFWLYLKLDRLIPAKRIEALNKGLAHLTGGDKAAWNRDRLARLPGSVHPASNKTAELIALTGATHDPASLTRLDPNSEFHSKRHLTLVDTDESPVGKFGSFPQLRPELWTYIRSRPSQGQGIDRSAREQEIFVALLAQGWLASEVIAFADHYRLPRHRQELAKHGDYQWTKRSLNNAAIYLDENTDPRKKNPYIDMNSSMCMESCTKPQTDRLEALKLIDVPMRTHEVRALFEERFGCSRKTAFNILNQLIGGGYITKVDTRGRSTVQRTDRGEAAVAMRFRSALGFLPKVLK
jgi:hypothetical protein